MTDGKSSKGVLTAKGGVNDDVISVLRGRYQLKGVCEWGRVWSGGVVKGSSRWT